MKKTYSKEELNEAEKVSILSLCEKHGLSFIKSSKDEYHLEEHDSLMINPKLNRFFWNSRGYGGNVIQFARDVLGLSFHEAVEELLRNTYENAPTIVEDPPQPFRYYFKNNPNKERAINYLVEERKVDQDIVTLLDKKGFIQQVKRKVDKGDELIDAVAFVWAKNGKIVGATTQGIEIDFDKFGERGTQKKIVMNSEKHFGFNLTIGQPKDVYVFESPIDMLSYWSLNKQLDNCLLMAMDGLKHDTVMNALHYAMVGKGTKSLNAVHLCVDNDYAGSKFCERFERFERFKREVPYDNAVPKNVYGTFLEVLKEKQSDMPIELCCAIHKTITNFTETSDIKKVNPNAYMKYFGEVEKKDQGKLEVCPVELSSAAKHLIEEYDSWQPKNKVKLEAMLKHNTTYTDTVVHSIVNNIYNYLDMYQQQNLIVLPSYPKDWNDVLKGKAQALSRPIELVFQNESGQRLIVERNQSNQKLSAYVKEQDNNIPVFEADSPEEAAFLAKNYGFQSVDREDQRKYFGKVKNQGTEAKVPEVT